MRNLCPEVICMLSPLFQHSDRPYSRFRFLIFLPFLPIVCAWAHVYVQGEQNQLKIFFFCWFSLPFHIVCFSSCSYFDLPDSLFFLCVCVLHSKRRKKRHPFTYHHKKISRRRCDPYNDCPSHLASYRRLAQTVCRRYPAGTVYSSIYFRHLLILHFLHGDSWGGRQEWLGWHTASSVTEFRLWLQQDLAR